MNDDNRRIAKNTIYLYSRMIVMMLVTLYTSRIILEKLGVDDYEKFKELALSYEEFFKTSNIDFIKEPKDSKSNYWLQAILLNDLKQRDEFLEFTNKNGVMTRPIWRLMNELEMYKYCQKDELKNAKYLEQRVVNIPSSVRL